MFDHVGHPAAAVTVTFRRDTRPEETWPALAARVRATAAEITRRLGGRARGRARGRAARDDERS